MDNLYSAKKNAVYNLIRVPDIGLLKNLGLSRGTTVAIRERYALGGPVLLNVEDSFDVAIGKDIAVQITVGPL